MAGVDNAATPENAVLRQVMNSVDVAIAYFDADDKLVFWNDAYVDLNSTIAPMIRKGALFQDLLAELLIRGQIANVGEDVSAWVEQRMIARSSGQDAVRQLSDGRCFHVRELKVPQGGTLGFWTDITATKNVAAVAYDSPLGDLVNEFNNQLQAIGGNVELALDRTADPQVAGFLHQALAACMRLGSRTREIASGTRR